MDMWSFVTFWDYVKYIATQNGVEISFQEDCHPVDAVSFHARNPQTKKVTAFYISKLDLDNLAEPAKMLTEKLLDMIREVKE